MNVKQKLRLNLREVKAMINKLPERLSASALHGDEKDVCYLDQYSLKVIGQCKMDQVFHISL
jgi:hypothetical protein